MKDTIICLNCGKHLHLDTETHEDPYGDWLTNCCNSDYKFDE